MEHSEFLEKLGLGKRESVTYLALLEHGRGSVSDLSRRTGLFRTQVYDALDGLTREGLVAVSPKGKYKMYTAESPKKLEEKFLELSNRFDKEITELSQLYHSPDAHRPIVKYVEGQKGITSIHDDIVTSLKHGDIYYRYSSSKVTQNEWRTNYLSKKYRILRDQKKLERRVITNLPNKLQKRPRLEREVKAVPPDFDLFEYNVSQIIYGNKVAVIDYNTETAVVIENPTIAKFQEKIFQLLFRKL
ncbi:MAG TPA: helix-turn-helix domain-containing protein [Candidatus Paceibacterota bacterium]